VNKWKDADLRPEYNPPKLKGRVNGKYCKHPATDWKKIVVGCDVAYGATGLVAMEIRPELQRKAMPVLWRCIRKLKPANKQHVYQAEVDILKIQGIREEIMDFCLHECSDLGYTVAALVVETPHGGAQGARANRCMGLATGMIACIAQELEAYSVLTEWVQPNEIKRAFKTNSKTAIQEAVMHKWQEFEWPTVKADLEHVADAAAAVVVATGRPIWTMLTLLMEKT